MFILTSNMFGLAIVSLGVLGFIVTLLMTNRRRFLIGLSLSGLLVALGVFYVADTSVRQWLTARRIAKIQAQNRESLEAWKARRAEAPPQVSPAGTKKETPLPPRPDTTKRR